ncbi:hypothetical protein NDN08_007896 [Rhodosorus marinus]|uniref:Fanconi-associated nuclease n=1 Tax=Rhodosorus marinus TaxID=101924 RepID=A0AAV8V321_9RHOD|nr:hypothetical protein NDN08_007896 [Rhodosorus marinus]
MMSDSDVLRSREDHVWQSCSSLRAWTGGSDGASFCADPIGPLLKINPDAIFSLDESSAKAFSNTSTALQRLAAEQLKRQRQVWKRRSCQTETVPFVCSSFVLRELCRYGDAVRVLKANALCLEVLQRVKYSDEQVAAASWIRSKLLNAIAKVMNGEELSAIEGMEEDIWQGLMNSSSQEVWFWAVVYGWASLFLVLGDLNKSRRLLSELMTRNGSYRAKDVNSMAARVTLLLSERNGVGSVEEALNFWERSLVLDANRPGSLWASSSCLQIAGLHKQSADLLLCLEDSLKLGQRQTEPYVLEVPTRGKFKVARDSLDEESVQEARARRSACISSHDSRLQALRSYNELLGDREPGPKTTRMVLERAWLQTFLGDHDAALADLDSVVPKSPREIVMGEMCRANALVCRDDFTGAHEALERAQTECTASDFGSPVDSSRRYAAVQELRALLNTNQGVLVASNVRRKRRSQKFARASFDTATSSLETIPKQFKSSRTETIKTAAEFNRAVLQLEVDEMSKTWLGFRELGTPDATSASYGLEPPKTRYHYPRLTAEKVPASEARWLDEVILRKLREQHFDDEILAKLETLEKEWIADVSSKR